MQLTCGDNDVVRYIVGIGLWCVYVLFLLFFYHCFIASIAFIILPMYYGRFSVWNKTWFIDWLIVTVFVITCEFDVYVLLWIAVIK